MPVKHKNRTTVQSVPIVHLSNHNIDRNLTSGADIDAMNNRCVTLRPIPVQGLQNCPNLHPAIFSHYLDPTGFEDEPIGDIVVINHDKPDLDRCIETLDETYKLMWKEAGGTMEQLIPSYDDVRQHIYDFILKWPPITENQEGTMQMLQDMRIRLGIESVLSEVSDPPPPKSVEADEADEIAMLTELYAANQYGGQSLSEESTEI